MQEIKQEIKIVKCPNCGVTLSVKNSKNETDKIITCKKCNMKLHVSFPPNQAPLEAKTVLVGKSNPKAPASNGSETQLVGVSGATTVLDPPAKQPKKAYLLLQDRRYSLVEGINTIGRKASSSTATLQIETNDLYMSRRQVIIELKRLGDGSLKAFISNDKNKNKTFVGGTPLVEGDRVVLTHGTQIKMGRTIVTYQEES